MKQYLPQPLERTCNRHSETYPDRFKVNETALVTKDATVIAEILDKGHAWYSALK